MRIFIVLLLVANLLFVGVIYFVIEPQRAPVTEDLRREDNRSLTLLSELKRRELIADVVARDSKVQTQDVKPQVQCLKIVGDWDLNELALIKGKLESANKSVVSEGKERRKKVNYWVVIPPADSKQQAIIAKKSLQRAKIVDIFIIKSGVKENALSLGLYSKEEGAKRRAKFINEKNIGIARAAIEELTLYVDHHWIKVISDDGDLDSILPITEKGTIDAKEERCEIDR